MVFAKFQSFPVLPKAKGLDVAYEHELLSFPVPILSLSLYIPVADKHCGCPLHF